MVRTKLYTLLGKFVRSKSRHIVSLRGIAYNHPNIQPYYPQARAPLSTTKPKNSTEIRQAFLDFFAKREHQVVTSASLVPSNDPTLLFTNAGMVQFKDVFLGLDKRLYTRAASAQKCMRISGKHNDLENVGPSPRHNTFFEMLGNFSFGDYFKHEAIIYAYELLTKVYRLPPDRLAFTVYETDDEAYDIWTKTVGVDPQRVARMGPKTNFWQMADTGPCGPTSEIHWDLNLELGEKSIINALKHEEDRFLELWNLVFMQFNRTQVDLDHTGEFDQPLPSPGVDTGMGLERLVAVLQNAPSNYDTDLYIDIMDATQEILGHDDAFRQKHNIAYRVIADHTRAAAFLIADGVNPGTTGREYVPRMLIRRAWRFAHSMGVAHPFLTDVSEAVIHKMGDIYPELRQFRKAIRYQISTEEERFIRTLDHSLAQLESQIEQMEAAQQAEMSGAEAFSLFATHGLPLEITRDLLKERGLTVDETGFQNAMQEHIGISASGEKRAFADVSLYQTLLSDLQREGVLGPAGVAHDPYDYDKLSITSQILALLKDGQRVGGAQRGDKVEIVLPETPFYVESGGQVSDTGIIQTDSWEIQIEDAWMPVGGLILHVGKVVTGTVKEGARAIVSVDAVRRWDIMRNHTATHLLHASLREVLGEHVRQKGSLVAPDRLRFDFTHNAPLTPDELEQITSKVDATILANRPVETAFKPLEEARREGAMALFGEKYGEAVRTIAIPDMQTHSHRFSYELCGGTHVHTTAEVGPFLITSEESSSAGVRRITAVTGREAQRLIQERLDILSEIALLIGAEPDEAVSKVEHLRTELEDAYRKIEQVQRKSAKAALNKVKVKEISGIKLISELVDAPDMDMLGEMADWCRDQLDSGVVVLGSSIEDKARLVAKVTPDLVKRGLHAGRIIDTLAQIVGGGGGGRPDFATAGGKAPDKLPEAIAQVASLISEFAK